jgi:hypothetical protein
MNDHRNVEVSPVELTDDELETVSGSKAETITFMDALQKSLQNISDVTTSVIKNLGG